MPVTTFAYVSVFAWPEGWARERRVETLCQAGLGPVDAALRAGAPAPVVIARLEERAAGNVVRELRDAGLPVFAPTERQLRGMERPILAKRLVPVRAEEKRKYLVEPWRGEQTALRMEDVFLIVRAEVVSTRSAAGDPTTKVRFDAGSGTMHLERVEGPPKRTGPTEMIELHTGDGQRVRIDGNKFNFDILGDRREMNDVVNMGLLGERLTNEASRATVERSFEPFVAPEGAVRTLPPGSPLSRTRAAEFEFYSAWLHMLYRSAVGV
jgi:hypothetical protein